VANQSNLSTFECQQQFKTRDLCNHSKVVCIDNKQQRPLTGFLHLEHVTEPQSGQMSRFCLGRAKNPDEHCKQQHYHKSSHNEMRKCFIKAIKEAYEKLHESFFFTHLNTPLEVRVAQQRPITYFALKQVMHIGREDVLQQNIEIGKVLEDGIFIGFVELGQLAERTYAVVYRSVGYLFVVCVFV